MNLTQLLEDQETQPLEEMLAARLGALLGESSPHVLAALALTAAAVRNGHVALDTRALPFVWGGPPLKDSPLVGAPDQDLPLILDGDLLYLHRYHHHESLLAHGLRARAGLEIAVDHETLEATLAKFFPEAEGAGIQDQRRAATVAATRALCVVTGGPGTGKTTLVVRLLATLVSLDAGPVRVRLLAPTGKAAHRLGESVNAQLDALGLTATQREACPTQAETLHRALGPIRGSRVRFRHDEATPIPADVVIVAMGPWTNRLLPPDSIGGVEVLGQKVHAARIRPRRVPSRAVFFQGLGDPEFYPRPDGDVYVCAYPDAPAAVTEEPGRVEVRPEAVRRLENVARALCSEMRDPAEAPAARDEETGAKGQSCHLPVTADGAPRRAGATPTWTRLR